MRRRLWGSVVFLGLAAGCASGPFARQQGNIPQGAAPSPQQLITHLNHNAQAVKSLECQQVSITAKQGPQTFGLDGMLAYQKPRNFRLMAEAVGTTQADLGSNNDEFWFWIKKADPPALYHCSYEDLPRVQALKMPLHPDWIAEALCIGEFGPPEQYKARTVGQTVELTTNTTSPQGQPLQKTTVVYLTGRDSGRVKSHHLRTAQGKEVWSAYIEEYQVVSGVALPRKVKLVCPDDKMELSLKLDRARVNGVAAKTGDLFVRPEMRGVQAIDLAGGPPVARPQSIQRVRGSSP